MSEKINLSEIADLREDNPIFWAMCEIMAHTHKGDLMQWQWKMAKPGGQIFEVDMKIDGIEVQFSTILKLLMVQYNDMIEKRAKEKLEEKFTLIHARLNDMMEEM
jgi:hypothetical protein